MNCSVTDKEIFSISEILLACASIDEIRKHTRVRRRALLFFQPRAARNVSPRSAPRACRCRRPRVGPARVRVAGGHLHRRRLGRYFDVVGQAFGRQTLCACASRTSLCFMYLELTRVSQWCGHWCVPSISAFLPQSTRLTLSLLPSQRLAPVWDELADAFASNGDVTIAKIDCTVSPAACASSEIRSYPTIKAFRRGESSIDCASVSPLRASPQTRRRGGHAQRRTRAGCAQVVGRRDCQEHAVSVHSMERKN